MWHCQQKAAMPQKYIDKSHIATYNSGIATNIERKEYMSMEEKKNEMIVEMVEKLRQMDSNSLTIMKASVDILAAKERLDKEEAKTA